MHGHTRVKSTHPLVRVLVKNLLSNDQADVTGHVFGSAGGCLSPRAPARPGRPSTAAIPDTFLHPTAKYFPCSIAQRGERVRKDGEKGVRESEDQIFENKIGSAAKQTPPEFEFLIPPHGHAPRDRHLPHCCHVVIALAINLCCYRTYRDRRISIK